MAVVGLVGVGAVEVAVHPSVVGEPTGSLRVVAVVGHEMVETQGVGVEQILVLDFATAGVGQDFAMGVVEHWRMAGEVVVVHVHQEEGTVQVHLEGEALLQAWLLVCSLMALDQMEPPRVEEQKMGLEQMMVAGRDLCSALEGAGVDQKDVVGEVCFAPLVVQGALVAASLVLVVDLLQVLP